MTVSRHDFKTDIVGESFYFDTLAECYHDPEALDCDGGKVVKVELVKDPNNPHDANAVAVYSKHGKIGHLSKTNARKYHEFMPDHLTATVHCRIWTSDPDEGIYGAWLGIDLDNPPEIPDIPPEAQNNTPLPPPKTTKKRKKFLGLF